MANALAVLFFASSIALCVMADARRHQRRLPYDFDSLVFFAWPLVVPVYLLHTRGWRAFATLGWFLLLYCVAIICGSLPAIIQAVRE